VAIFYFYVIYTCVYNSTFVYCCRVGMISRHSLAGLKIRFHSRACIYLMYVTRRSSAYEIRQSPTGEGTFVLFRNNDEPSRFSNVPLVRIDVIRLQLYVFGRRVRVENNSWRFLKPRGLRFRSVRTINELPDCGENVAES